jgi:hypothetical protein
MPTVFHFLKLTQKQKKEEIQKHVFRSSNVVYMLCVILFLF